MAEDPTTDAGTTLTTAEYAALARELESLRSRHRAELAERLRLARGFGGAADNDDLLAVLEEAPARGHSRLSGRRGTDERACGRSGPGRAAERPDPDARGARGALRGR